MPIAGPISILVTSNALKGRVRYCNMVSIGASIADFVYVFAAVFGLTKFYSLYKPVIPYVLLAGTLFLLYLGYKISKTSLDLQHVKDESSPLKKIRKEDNGFLTGFLLNFLNPTLFLGWLTSSFIVISLVASLGFNTGGLDKSVDNSFKTINRSSQDSTLKYRTLSYLHLDSVKIIKHKPAAEELSGFPKSFPLLLSLSYAFFLSLGSVIWFFYLAIVLAKHRSRIDVNVVNRIIRLLALVLCLLGLFLGYKAIKMLT